jgi:hypothetical protein
MKLYYVSNPGAQFFFKMSGEWKCKKEITLNPKNKKRELLEYF